MRRKNFFILAMMILWIGMIIRTFFWWQTNESNLKEPDEWWFIQDLTNTWNNSEFNSGYNENTGIKKEKKDYTEIRVMMPKYFYSSWIKRLAEDLYNDKKIYIKFIFIDDLNSYRDQLSNQNFSEADLFLFPYDWINKTPTRSFSPDNSIESYFDQLVQPIVKGPQISFLPFSADPMIMYAISWYSQNDFDTIFDYTTDRESTVPLSFPLFFGIISEDYNNKWFIREYQDIVRYALMHYFTTYKDSKSLWARIDSNALEKYNLENLNTISNAIISPNCQYFPSICFQTYKFVWLRFGFLSDTDVVNTYFTWKKANFNNLSKINVPFGLESPVRLRWRWMPSSLEDKNTINWIYIFYKQYMDHHNEYNLRNSTLSVFSWNNWEWLIYNDYIWLRWYLLTSWWDYISTLRGINKFRELIEYKISASEYLR